MVSASLVIVIVILLFFVLRKPEYGILATLILVGCGDLFDFFLPSIVKLASIFLIFIIEAYKGFKNKVIQGHLLVFFLLVVIKELLGFFFVPETNVNHFVTAIYVYIIIVTISIVSFKEIRKKNIDFWKQYTVYIIIGLLIQLVRAFYDYQFFGVKPYLIDEVGADSFYEIGGVAYRPSSLMTPIVFSIELGVFIGATVIRKGITLKTLPMLLWAIIGLMLTNSRSGMVVLILVGIYWIVKNKRLVAGAVFATIVVGALFLFNYAERLQTIFDFKNHTYDTRFKSINKTLGQVADFGVDKVLFGAGYGAANYIDENGDVLYYVEDFYISLLVNSGYITSLLFLGYLFYVISRGLRIRSSNVLLLVCILLVNFFACSLMIYTVQLLFWVITLSILWDYKEISLNYS